MGSVSLDLTKKIIELRDQFGSFQGYEDLEELETPKISSTSFTAIQPFRELLPNATIDLSGLERDRIGKTDQVENPEELWLAGVPVLSFVFQRLERLPGCFFLAVLYGYDKEAPVCCSGALCFLSVQGGQIVQ